MGSLKKILHMSLYIYIIATQLFFFEVDGNFVNGEDGGWGRARGSQGRAEVLFSSQTKCLETWGHSITCSQ
jgi:hypothetical protein